MDTLARQDVRQTDPGGKHFHPHFACVRGRDILFDGGDHFRATVVRDDNSRVVHVPDLGVI